MATRPTNRASMSAPTSGRPRPPARPPAGASVARVERERSVLDQLGAGPARRARAVAGSGEVPPAGGAGTVAVATAGPASIASGHPLPARTRIGRRASLTVERAGYAALGLQWVAMVVFSTVQYARYSLSNDFAGYAQAWRAIAAGHLDPWVSVFRVDFLHNNLDLVLYPLALLEPLCHNPVVLCWAEDGVIALTGAVTLRWAAEILGRDQVGPAAHRAVLAGVTVALVVDPWAWETAAFPLHFEPFAALFALLAARAMWRGRTRELLVWVPLAMTSEALGSVYVLAVGLAGVLLGRSTRRAGAVLAAAGLSGLGIVMSLGVVGRNQATIIDTYGYLVPGDHGHIALSALVLGLAGHASAALRVMSGHLPYLLGYLVAGGVLGVFSPVGLTAAACILVPDAFSSHAEFIDFTGAFQNWPAEPLLTAGTVMVLSSLSSASAGRRGPRRAARRRALAAIVGTAMLVNTVVLATMTLPRIPRAWILGARPARELGAIARMLPPGAEVIADQNILGRLASGANDFSLYRPGQTFPIGAGAVAIVLEPGVLRRDRLIAERLSQDLPDAVDVRLGRFEALIWHAKRPGSLTILT